jgi:hypothetical protein
MTNVSIRRAAAWSTFVLAVLLVVPGDGIGIAGSGSDQAVPNQFTTRPSPSSLVDSSYIPMDSPEFVGKNRRVIRGPGAQSETTIAVDPTNPAHMMAASNNLAPGATALIYETVNRGKTWVEAGLGLGSTFCYDPWVDFNAAGDVFYAYECSDQRIAYRKVGQTTWTKTILNAGSFPDRSMVVVDTTSTSPFLNSVYIGYDDNGSSNKAYIMYSRDGFSGWVRSPKINDSTALTIGVNAAVAPDGTLYATWEDFAGKKIMVDRSIDGGVTWSTDHVVHNYRLNTGTFFISIPPQPDRGVLPMPFTDVAPSGTAFAGRLYVAYFDKAQDGGANTDVFVRHSDDGGLTWSAEAKVNDDTVDAYHFHTTISVDPNGVVGVSFYDTRDDPGVNKKTNQYVSFSTDGGVTWSLNQKVTSAPSDESGFGDSNDYGDYQGIDAGSDGNFYSIWCDSRGGQEDVMMSQSRP